MLTRLLLSLTFATTATAGNYMTPADLQSDFNLKERVLLIFPSYAYEFDGRWFSQIRGWVFEPEQGEIWRSLAAILSAKIGLPEGSEDNPNYQRRIRWFLVDNERRQWVTLKVGDKSVVLGPTEPNGHFNQIVEVPPPHSRELLSIERFPYSYKDHEGVLEIQYVPASGTSIISDIDDTVKVTGVLSRDEMIANTFLNEFRSVPGMSALTNFDQTSIPVHFVSASPWQLYSELWDLFERDGITFSSMDLRNFRIWDGLSLYDFIRNSKQFKLNSMRRIFSEFPGRKFILIGDSGELDPEIYGEIATQFPDQVRAILIREVPEADNSVARFKNAIPARFRNRFRSSSDPSKLLEFVRNHKQLCELALE